MHSCGEMTVRVVQTFRAFFGITLTPAVMLAQSVMPAESTPWRDHVFSSTILKEERHLLVVVPDGYDKETRAYPVLWLLDAGDKAQFGAAIANVRFLTARGAIPPLIIVGVRNGSDRTRDLTPPPDAATRKTDPSAGGVDRFLDFVEQEAKPVVMKAYRAAPYAVFAGHSYGGLTALRVAGTRPSMANAVVAMSPSLWFNESALIGPWSKAIAVRTTPLRLFTSRGGEEAPIDVNTARFERRLDSLLTHRKSVLVSFGHRRYPDDPHSMTPLTSLIDGLRYVFAPYSMAVTDVERMADPFKADSAAWVPAMRGMERQWANRLKAFPPALMGESGVDQALPESFFVWSPTLAAVNPAAGLAMAKRAVELRPQSATALRLLGEVHAMRGDTVAARARLSDALDRAKASKDSAATAAVERVLTKLNGASSKAPSGR